MQLEQLWSANTLHLRFLKLFSDSRERDRDRKLSFLSCGRRAFELHKCYENLQEKFLKVLQCPFVL